jgi:hypothetical protein
MGDSTSVVKKPVRSPDAIVISVTLEPGTEEFRAFNRVKRKYHEEMAKRQKNASDDDPCETHFRKSEVGRGGILALDNVSPEKLPEYIHAATKPIGRPSANADEDSTERTSPDAKLDDRATLLH